MCECCVPTEKEKKEWEEYAKKREEQEQTKLKKGLKSKQGKTTVRTYE